VCARCCGRMRMFVVTQKIVVGLSFRLLIRSDVGAAEAMSGRCLRNV